MQLHQLRYILEVCRSGNHISAAAEILHTSQPGISKQIRLLELELGFDIFERTRNRIVGVTEAGKEVIKITEMVLSGISDIKKVGSDYNGESSGKLTIATTHTFARYVLPRVVKTFMQKHPTVHVGLMQGNPTEVCEYVQAGHADIAVATDSMKPFLGVVRMPCFTITRSVIASKGHPILDLKTIGLQDLANYPIIAHDNFRSGGWTILDTFAQAGIKPKIQFSGVDSDVAKTYVEIGLGIAILASIAVDPVHDGDLQARDVSNLFSSSIAYVSFRKSAYIRKFDLDFMNILSPTLTRRKILDAREDASEKTAPGGSEPL
ncbi:LysR family transcriptional regulator [Mesorhizobium sp. M7A.F.Ca.US.006.01.1.1]|uniref:LysR substrate-binding domain-containing protein n=1 Tax=Mesorhizobium sp. M7A.F.Ca.US.006.01.1.1 TaxID=2496707 RepID=UPI000FCAA0C5|nr:LysR substrate-binding domain-containing protein [Mesorhizobium sp. M7A.F.Ca.US.006.01.1.1]RUZ77972.1 LysR family transcriptional regulator [Mesorhizobium sp. M7A.F.Ca.US.006.01.1.1]